MPRATSAQAPTDSDLQAAYCLGASRSVAVQGREMAATATHRGSSEALCREGANLILESAETMRLRFARFIVARGYNSGGPIAGGVRGLTISPDPLPPACDSAGRGTSGSDHRRVHTLSCEVS
jgi:hypothetical protein